jgi:dTMP kinase
MTPGKFITFEGGEGSGKSTQARLLAEHLRAAGRDVVATREPGGTPFAEQVRALLLDPATAAHAPVSEALLFYAARADHLEKVIRPALAAARWVVCDRFSDSTDVYQAHAGGLDRATFEMLEHAIVGSTRPSLTFVIDIDPAVGRARALQRRVGAAATAARPAAPDDGGDSYERRDMAFHEALRRGFLAIAEAEPQRCVVIDGSRPEQEVAAAIRAVLARRMPAVPAPKS